MERRLRDSQFGFMPGRGVTDAIFAVRQRMEKQGKTGLYIMVCIHLEKAYDRVPRQEVWRRNREKGLPLPDNYVMIVQDMYAVARTRANTNVHGQ